MGNKYFSLKLFISIIVRLGYLWLAFGREIPGKYIRLVKMFYDNDRCSVLTEGGIGESFSVKSGVKQGCVMSGFLFILVIDWIMRKTVTRNDTGIQWSLTKKLEDLDSLR